MTHWRSSLSSFAKWRTMISIDRTSFLRRDEPPSRAQRELTSSARFARRVLFVAWLIRNVSQMKSIVALMSVLAAISAEAAPLVRYESAAPKLVVVSIRNEDATPYFYRS